MRRFAEEAGRMRARASAAREGPEVEIRVNHSSRPVGEVIEVGGRAMGRTILLGLFVQVVDVDRRAGRDVPHAR